MIRTLLAAIALFLPLSSYAACGPPECCRNPELCENGKIKKSATDEITIICESQVGDTIQLRRKSDYDPYVEIWSRSKQPAFQSLDVALVNSHDDYTTYVSSEIVFRTKKFSSEGDLRILASSAAPLVLQCGRP